MLYNRSCRVSRYAFATAVPLFTLFLLLPGTGYPQSPVHLVGTVPGTGAVVTVTEGPGEPRSIGSYAIRLYRPLDPAWPFDNFTSGMVRNRDGAVESLVFEDIDGDATDDVIVVVRAAGSGGYLFADAYRVIENRLDLAAHVEWLDRMADPVAALRQAVKRRNQD